MTAERWARLLRELGHSVRVTTTYDGRTNDVLIAIHARKSHPAVTGFRIRNPDHPIVVALAGTDLYGDLASDRPAQESLALANRLVVLQERGVMRLPRQHREKTRVIVQSAVRVESAPVRVQKTFDVCVLAHLRPVKDPFRAAHAAQLLPASSTVRVVHVGAALSDDMAFQARAHQRANQRYRWLGELPRAKALHVLARSRLLVVSSESEGGANVVSEAVVNSVPVIASEIDGSVGLLGEQYPGYFPVGDTSALAALLERCESDVRFYRALSRHCSAIAPQFDPANERERWREVLEELGVRS